MNRMKLAQECVEIDEAGGNVLDFLRMRGCISPWGTWYRLQIEELGRNKGQITEGKGENDMRKMTLEEKKKAVQIALDGGDPLAYLKSLGSKKPDALWYAIQSRLMDADPDMFEKLMLIKKYKERETTNDCDQSTRKGVDAPDEIPEKKPTAQLIAKVVPVKLEEVKDLLDAPVADAKEKPKPGIVSTLTHDKDGNLRMEVGRPLEKYGVEVTGLKTKVGEFLTVGERLSWNTPGMPLGHPVIVTLPGETWRELLAVLPIVMETMNI